MSGALVACALFPLALIERLTPRDPALDAKMCNRVDLFVWRRQRVDLQEQGWIVGHVKRTCLQAGLVGTLGDAGALRLLPGIFLHHVCVVLCVFSFFITDALQRSSQACDV